MSANAPELKPQEIYTYQDLIARLDETALLVLVTREEVVPGSHVVGGLQGAAEVVAIIGTAKELLRKQDPILTELSEATDATLDRIFRIFQDRSTKRAAYKALAESVRDLIAYRNTLEVKRGRGSVPL